MSSATAVIQFIGLILFSRELTPNHDLTALIPRIVGHQSHQPRSTALAAANRERRKTQISGVGAGVEEHAAFIAFPAGDYLSSKGWAPVGLETANGYLFVRLDGEHITFVSGGVVKATELVDATQGRGSPTAAARAGLDILGLPHLQNCCKGAKLKAEFSYPHFDGAVAVFNLPSLKVNSCNANADNVNVSRIDSRALIENGGVLIISARKNGQKKEIRLRGATTVIVAHMPSDVITGKPTAGGTARHYQAYYDMIEQGTCDEDYKGCATASPANRPCRDKSIIREGVTLTGAIGDPSANNSELPWWVAARTDFECSNSQWP